VLAFIFCACTHTHTYTRTRTRTHTHTHTHTRRARKEQGSNAAGLEACQQYRHQVTDVLIRPCTSCTSDVLIRPCTSCTSLYILVRLICPYMCPYVCLYMCPYMCACMCAYMCAYMWRLQPVALQVHAQGDSRGHPLARRAAAHSRTGCVLGLGSRL